MRWILAALLVCAPSWAAAQLAEPPHDMVREVVFNELHDHQAHGYWRYWIAQHADQNRVSEQVETADGPVTRVVSLAGRQLSREAAQQEEAKLRQLLNSPEEQARRRQAYADDERRIGRIVALLPDAFDFEYAGEQDGCHRLRFHPRAGYAARTVEERIFHAMTGEIWIDARMKRLARLEGRLTENVDFGYGLLGRLYAGGWFRLERTEVSPTDWKTERLEIHMNGRALLFKTIARETSEMRGGFSRVPAGLTLAEGIALLDGQQQSALGAAPMKADVAARR